MGEDINTCLQYHVLSVYVSCVVGNRGRELAMFWGPRESGPKMRWLFCDLEEAR